MGLNLNNDPFIESLRLDGEFLVRSQLVRISLWYVSLFPPSIITQSSSTSLLFIIHNGCSRTAKAANFRNYLYKRAGSGGQGQQEKQGWGF